MSDALLLSLDPRRDDVAHAAIRANEAVTADTTFRWNTRLSRERTQGWRVRALTIQILDRILTWSPRIAGISLLMILPQALFGDLEDGILLTQDVRLLIFWAGMLAFPLRYSIRKREARRARLLPLRPLEEKLQPLPSGAFTIPKKTRMVRVDRCLNEDACLLIARAFALARKRGHRAVVPLHLVAGSMGTADASFLCTRLGIERSALSDRLEHLLEHLPVAASSSPESSPALTTAFLVAAIECLRERRRNIGIGELLVAAVSLDRGLTEVLDDLGVSASDLRHVVAWSLLAREHGKRSKRLQILASAKPKRTMNVAMTARPTPVLDSISRDYTQTARAGGFGHLFGRDEEIGEAFRTMKSTLGNVLFVGEPGTGKSELLKGIANLMAAEVVPSFLQDKRLVVLDPGAIIAGAPGVGGIENLFRKVIQEVTGAGNILLAIEDIHHLLGASSTRSSEDAGHMLMNELSERKLRVIATTTTQEFATHIRPVETFLRRFQVIEIREMNFFDTIRVMEARAGAIEKTHRVVLSFPALRACYELCEHLMPGRYFPDKALQTMEELATFVRERKGDGATILAEDAATLLSRKTNVDVTRVSDGEAEKLLAIEEAMHERVVGQEEAVQAIASALRRARTKLRATERPIASFLFLGPTGVGKTETAKTIAQVYFGSERAMTRLDMSEFQTQGSVERLLGTSGKTSPFLDAIRTNPHRLILLDEFEKAHPDLLNLFLQVFDDGRLTDGAGKTVSFVHTMLIATSNAGSNLIQESIRNRETYEHLQQSLMLKELPKYFKPELLNRFDRLVTFTPLTEDELHRVAERMLRSLEATLGEQGIKLEVREEAIAELVARGFDPTYGARPLRRLIQDTLEDGIAKILLRKEAGRRDTIVVENISNISVQKGRVLVGKR
jgi:ATP-dependent Clp protease ATP-binding subunit ClpC